MEGVTGVTWTDDVVAGTEPWQRFRRLFTGDVNACVAGLHDAGATDVVVNEAHSAQRNLLLEELDPRARMLTGRHKPLSMMQGVDSGVDGVVFLGYHTGAGEEGVLSHTYLENSITGVWLDGVRASEGRLNAALASYPKPVVGLMDGICMGGGVGITAHGSHRVVTERSKIGMPEVGIGFVPDVGGTYLLSRAPGELGTHLVLSPRRAGIYDTLYGLCRSGRMQCGKYEMSGLGSEQCCGNCLVISHLSY